eukprot:gnl/MRDRNA2_/MRDRNA2_77042_c0_seq2.p1 gnl/MRDRNA2_/MRDRNA2_77042_c0~~gnl/MRDRNA2_/MRDRNA2_77042_c0_seq2.p1  ORF type:complete len:272 (+),score=71.37 gnl/MRDRNA2_/MRDRNA2_77042_c0_seq2:388-1203(+)
MRFKRASSDKSLESLKRETEKRRREQDTLKSASADQELPFIGRRLKRLSEGRGGDVAKRRMEEEKMPQPEEQRHMEDEDIRHKNEQRRMEEEEMGQRKEQRRIEEEAMRQKEERRRMEEDKRQREERRRMEEEDKIEHKMLDCRAEHALIEIYNEVHHRGHQFSHQTLRILVAAFTENGLSGALPRLDEWLQPGVIVRSKSGRNITPDHVALESLPNQSCSFHGIFQRMSFTVNNKTCYANGAVAMLLSKTLVRYAATIWHAHLEIQVKAE